MAMFEGPWPPARHCGGTLASELMEAPQPEPRRQHHYPTFTDQRGWFLARGHTAPKWPSQDLDPGACSSSRFIFLALLATSSFPGGPWPEGGLALSSF